MIHFARVDRLFPSNHSLSIIFLPPLHRFYLLIKHNQVSSLRLRISTTKVDSVGPLPLTT